MRRTGPRRGGAPDPWSCEDSTVWREAPRPHRAACTGRCKLVQESTSSMVDRPAKPPPQQLVDHGVLPRRPARKSTGDTVLIDAIVAHLNKHAGTPSTVYHDGDCRWVHLDVHLVGPGTRGDRWLLCTSGMAERPLRTPLPQDRPDRLWTELVMVLPPSWDLSEATLTRPESFWPIGWLRFLGRQPHATGVGYLPGDSISRLRDPREPGPSPFDGALFVPSTRVPPMTMVGRQVRFLAVCPLFAAEIAVVRDHGSRALLAGLHALGCDPEVVDIARREVTGPDA